jgi:hypothetical protein
MLLPVDVVGWSNGAQRETGGGEEGRGEMDGEKRANERAM